MGRTLALAARREHVMLPGMGEQAERAAAVGPRLRTVDAGGLSMQVADAGSGPPVALLHGFPELWYSWRHQLRSLAGAGFHAIAPDMRGYGGTEAPPRIEDYDVVTLTGDVLALMLAFGYERFAVVGHDWGANVAWELARRHPERISAVAGLSVPFVPRAPAPPVGILRRHLGEGFYMVWIQEPGVADAALARDVRRTLRTSRVWDATWADVADDDPPRPAFWSEADEAVYVDTFTRTGFTGGLNWYRNIDRNWELTEDVADRRIEQPALFLTGERDPVRRFMPDAAMDGWVTDLRERIVVDGAGHWVQQQAPEIVDAALIRFLREAG
jgi:pimeloyl-ACP methyl ester carboxylesterase